MRINFANHQVELKFRSDEATLFAFAESNGHEVSYIKTVGGEDTIYFLVYDYPKKLGIFKVEIRIWAPREPIYHRETVEGYLNEGCDGVFTSETNIVNVIAAEVERIKNEWKI